MSENPKRRSILTNWSLIPMYSGYQLTGRILHDDRQEDGTVVYSSKLLRIDFEKGFAETRNTIYKLT